MHDKLDQLGPQLLPLLVGFVFAEKAKLQLMLNRLAQTECRRLDGLETLPAEREQAASEQVQHIERVRCQHTLSSGMISVAAYDTTLPGEQPDNSQMRRVLWCTVRSKKAVPE